MIKIGLLSIQTTIIAWSVFLTVFIVPQFFYFLAIYGFFDYEDNDKLVEVPIMIDKLSLKPIDDLRRCRGNIKMSSLPCLSGKFSYIYEGKTYRSNRVAAGMLRVSNDKAELILKKLESERQAYIQPNNPEYALLIPRQKYINYHPVNSATEWFRRSATIPAIFALALFSVMFLPRKIMSRGDSAESKQRTYGVGVLWLRFLAFWIDLSTYIFSVVIFIVFFGLFYLSDYAEKSIFIQLYLYLGFPTILLLSSLVFSRTLGMYALGLRIVDAKTDRDPTFWQRVIRIFGILLIVITAGFPLIISVFSKGRRNIADILSATKVVQEFVGGKTVFSALVKTELSNKIVGNDKDTRKPSHLRKGDCILMSFLYLVIALTVFIFLLLAFKSNG